MAKKSKTKKSKKSKTKKWSKPQLKKTKAKPKPTVPTPSQPSAGTAIHETKSDTLLLGGSETKSDTSDLLKRQ
jgi:hypothetical protein